MATIDLVVWVWDGNTLQDWIKIDSNHRCHRQVGNLDRASTL